MNYMPKKSRKWLASGIATAVIASALSLFTVAPASAASATVTISKAVRATDTASESVARTGGNGSDDTAAIIWNFDDSLGDLGFAVEDTVVYIAMLSRPSTNASITFVSDDTDAAAMAENNTEGNGLGQLTDLNSYRAIGEAGVDMNGEVFYSWDEAAIDGDDTRIGLNFNVDEVGTYTFRYFWDIDSSSSESQGDIAGTFTIEAYGAPVLTVSPTTNTTATVGTDDTYTITNTGGSFATNERAYLVDESTISTKFSVGVVNANMFTATAGANVLVDDTFQLSDTSDWVKTGVNTSTFTFAVRPTADVGDDFNGTIRIYGLIGNVSPYGRASALTITYTATTLVSGIYDVAITAPTTNFINNEDTTAAGVWTHQIKLADAPVTISGTFEVGSSSDYGKAAKVGIYGVGQQYVTALSTPISSSSVTTNAEGVGTFTFTINASYLDGADDSVAIVVGSPGVTQTAASTTPKRVHIDADAASLTPEFTVNGQSWSGRGAALGGKVVAAIGGTITASVVAKSQFGTAMTGYTLKATTASTQRNASLYKTAAVDAAGRATVSYTDAGTTASTSTSTTWDAVTLSLVLGTADDTNTTGTFTAAFGAPTLTSMQLNGSSEAVYTANEYEPWVPFDGQADAYSSNTNDDSDGLMKVTVTSSFAFASNVVFTGSSGVRFDGAAATSVSTAADAGTSGVRHDLGRTQVQATTALDGNDYVATVYFYCITVGSCKVTATQAAATLSASVTYGSPAAAAFNVTDVKVNDVAGLSGTAAADKKVKVSFKVTDVFGNAIKTFGETGIGVDIMVKGVGSIDGLGSQGTLKTAADGTAQFYASSSAAGAMQIDLDGSGGDFGDSASTALAKPASADKKTVTITWSAAPAPEVVYAAPTLTVTKSGNKIILDGTAVEGEGDIIVYIKRVGTTKWVEQAATIEVAAPGDYNGMRIAPKSNVLIRVKQEGTGKFSNQVVVLK